MTIGATRRIGHPQCSGLAMEPVHIALVVLFVAGAAALRDYVAERYAVHLLDIVRTGAGYAGRKLRF